MPISEKDIKLLWGRAGNRCAICQCELSATSPAAASPYTLGVQAHIIAAAASGPRGSSNLTPEERDTYANLILLCPTDHAVIDKNPAEWTPEKLYVRKATHELWVQETLGNIPDKKAQAAELAVAGIVDSAVTNCRLVQWQRWTRAALALHPRWPKQFPEQITAFRQQVMATIWPPEYEELRRATETLSILLVRAIMTFSEHADERGDLLVGIPFYKLRNPNPHYDRDLARFEAWMTQCHDLVFTATKAANWFADVVRRDVNPLFFIQHGKFLLEESMGPGDIAVTMPEFSDEEKKQHPDVLFRRDESTSPAI